ncbi:hypothetical protein [Propionimicrobium sp. PCR01-08-3]|uniref:hypothetical protein n=1 Tax=Propionimicrobium sp. PCR01-08-3 TaxID=3052086 RepID=UPI00255D15AB|nr:hypothetical protein [Propionimicrobium sp. PCR01-08-3]WIY84302.1 hypothetical protein QQ658_15185 [Propionimicrobium sp. PCR01-08-3]
MNRLYKAAYVIDEEQIWDDDIEMYGDGYIFRVDANPTTEAEGAPEGWDEYCEDKWGEPHEFFIPSDRPIYRSRSAAQDRVNLINRWGGHAVLMECTPEWTTVAQANAWRKLDRLADRMLTAQKKVDALHAQYSEIARGAAL